MTDNQEKKPNSDDDLESELRSFLLNHDDISTIEATTVRGTRLRISEANQVAPFSVLGSEATSTFKKEHQSREKLIQILSERGLEIDDELAALEWLQKVGYYRLSGFGLQFRNQDEDGNLVDTYKKGTRFEQLTDLYQFDRHLRLLVLDAIERIEIAFRERLNDTMATRYGPHWFLNPKLFSKKTKKNSKQPLFDHQEFLVKTYEEARRNKESLSIKHYYTTYGDPPIPPCWMLADVLSMGNWSKAYGMLAEASDQKPVSKYFRASTPELTSWIHALTNLRNACAHHSRLWDRRFIFCPSKKKNLKNVLQSNDLLFAQIATVLYCLWSIEPESQWLEHLIQLIDKHPSVTLEPMGFPSDWKEKLASLAPTKDATGSATL